MKRLLSYQFLFWIFLSIGLFVFVLPIPAGIVVKVIAGYVFYLFIKEIFYRYFKEAVITDRRIDVLNKRIRRLPQKISVYIHKRLDKSKDKEKKKKEKENMGQYM